MPIDEVNVALQRLLRLGMLEMIEPARWIARCGDTVAGVEGFTQAALERLAEAARALSVDRARAAPREHSSTTLAIDSRRLPQALALVARLRGELVRLFEQDETRDDVYRLEIHLFPLTRLEAEKDDDDGPTRDAVPDPGAPAG